MSSTPAFRPTALRRGRRRSPLDWLAYLPLGVLFVFAVAPLLLAWFAAFKTGAQTIANPYGPPIPPTFANLVEAWTVGRFGVYFRNSVVVSVASVLGVLVLASLGGYAFGRLRFPGQTVLLYALLLGLTIPVAAIVIPLYVTMRDVRLLDSYWSVVVANIALAAPVFVFVMRAFFRDVPRELDDAARIDGASEWQVFWQVMLPLARPGLVTVGLLEFLWSWNELFLPLVFLVSDDLRTLPLGTLFFQGRFTTDYGLMSAGILILSLPVTVLFLFFQRDFVKGLAAGALKG